MRKTERVLRLTLKKEAPGAELELNNRGHYRVTHPAFSKPLFIGSTPSDKRSMQNFVAEVRREMAGIATNKCRAAGSR